VRCREGEHNSGGVRGKGRGGAGVSQLPLLKEKLAETYFAAGRHRL